MNIDPIETICDGLSSAVGRAALVTAAITASLLLGIVAWIASITVWPRYVPPEVNLTSLHGSVFTKLEPRKIWLLREGFVDSTVFAVVPMTLDEFRKLVREQGMVESADHSVPNPPRWWKRPTRKLWRLDRRKNSTGPFEVISHYDTKTRRAYVCYYDT